MAGKYLLGATGGIVSYIAGNYFIDKQTAGSLPVSYDRKPSMKVAGGVDLLPAMSAIFKSLPDSTRRNLLCKTNAPKGETVPDWFDHFGENPYKIEEVVPGKVWSVEYKLENFMAFDPMGKPLMKMFGMDFEDEEVCWRTMQAAEPFGREFSDQTLKDIERVKEVEKMMEEKGKTPETVKEVGPFKLFMTVVKLNNGDVLLYSPVRVRDDTDLGGWLEKIGPVKWIVLGSSAHTVQIPATFKRYPEATYISSADAWNKLVHVNGWTKKKADFEYDDPRDLERLNNLLVEEGIQFYYVNGDSITQGLIPIAHGTAMECDLIYSTSDGGFLHVTKDEMNDNSKENAQWRLFRLCLAAKPASPNGFLPIYRYWMMDPKCPMAIMNISPPAKDGSSCSEMAQSLRSILSEKIDHACGVHTGPISGQLFKESMDANWGWLDGDSLLKPKSS